MTLRFAVGHAGGPQSNSWKLWANQNDVYLLERGAIARHAKFSFHETGNCRWARIQKGVSGLDRAMLEWQRDEVPPAGSGNAVTLLSIAFPTNHLSAPKAKKEKQLRWITPASQGRAVINEIFLTYEKRAAVEQMLSLTGERQLLYHTVLRSGLRLCATVSQFDCGPVDMNMPTAPAGGSEVFGEMRFPDRDDSDTGRLVRLVIMAGEKLPPLVWELGGYEVAKVKPRHVRTAHKSIFLPCGGLCEAQSWAVPPFLNTPLLRGPKIRSREDDPYLDPTKL